LIRTCLTKKNILSGFFKQKGPEICVDNQYEALLYFSAFYLFSRMVCQSVRPFKFCFQKKIIYGNENELSECSENWESIGIAAAVFLEGRSICHLSTVLAGALSL